MIRKRNDIIWFLFYPQVHSYYFTSNVSAHKYSRSGANSVILLRIKWQRGPSNLVKLNFLKRFVRLTLLPRHRKFQVVLFPPENDGVIENVSTNRVHVSVVSTKMRRRVRITRRSALDLFAIQVRGALSSAWCGGQSKCHDRCEISASLGSQLAGRGSRWAVPEGGTQKR